MWEEISFLVKNLFAFKITLKTGKRRTKITPLKLLKEIREDKFLPPIMID